MHKLFHLLPAETAHSLAISALKFGLAPHYKTPQKPVEVFGLKFPNAIGMAAGFDKNAEAIDGLFGLGFGFVEVGTVTPRPQTGNPKPRIFRLPEQEAVINRLGFNNAGINVFLENIAKAKRKGDGILGINIGANKDTLNFADDYALLIPKITEYADYITVNISSPNTPGLRDLQKKEAIRALAENAVTIRNAQDKKPPLLVKISPDLSDEDLATVIDALMEAGIDGVIATNTTIGHTEKEKGGLSGKPLFEKSTDIVRKISAQTGGRLPIIAVGGVSDAAGAKAKFDAGASLVQIYTGMIYKGQRIAIDIVEGL